MAYAVRSTRSRAPVDQGYFFMKIKIGQPGTQAEMLEKDMARLSAIHAAIGDARTPYSSTGKLPYYFDANGRYESKDAPAAAARSREEDRRLRPDCAHRGAVSEELEIDIRDIPARVAADESAHTGQGCAQSESRWATRRSR